MNAKERIMAALRHEKTDVVPVTVYSWFIPRGYLERQTRNRGLCLVESTTPVYGIRTPNVKMHTVEDSASFYVDDRFICLPKQRHVVHRTYETPVGTVSEKYKWGFATVEWPCEWLIKDLQDYQTVEFIIDDTEYVQNYEGFSKVEEVLGEDGIAVAMPPKSPLECMLLELMGTERFSLDYRMHRQEFDRLYTLLCRKQLEMYKVIADCPAEVVLLDDNITGVVVNPVLFEKYCTPFYDRVAEILHSKQKILMVHLDGKLKCLRDLIARTKIDVVEAFTPPPIGDLSIEEARTTWKGKVIWANFPATIYLESGLEGVERETVRMLRSAAPGDDFALGITEDIGDINSVAYQRVLETIAKTVMKHGVYPIAKS